MSNKPLNVLIFKNSQFSCIKTLDGFWIYDKVLKMNISMRAKDEQSACIEALEFYQRKLQESRSRCKLLSSKINTFIAALGIDNEI